MSAPISRKLVDGHDGRVFLVMKATVLFEGCGGATAGLHAAGYETVGYDFWQPAVTCARANGFAAHLHDLSDPAADHLIADADLWWASPPCQPFSAAGDGEGEFDDRDGFPWVLRLVAARLPKVLIVENVKGLTFRKHSAYFCAVLEGFRALGYEVDWRVLNCADHGVPQTRERTIIVCRRDGGPIVWPMPTHCETGGMFTLPWVTMAGALGWHEGDELTYNRGAGMTERHGPRGPFSVDRPAPTVHNNTAKDMRRMTLHYRQTDSHGTPITCDVTDRPAPTISTQSGSWTRPATTINGDNRVSAPGHHDPNVSGSQQAGAIRLAIAELAALQGFPADWVWTGTKTTNAKLIGNACPPALTHAVAAVNRPIDDAGTAPAAYQRVCERRGVLAL